LWDLHTGSVDQEAIKIEFFRKVHTKNPYFRTKLKHKQRDRIDVPPMVAYHYRNPPSLLPSLRDVLRIESLTKRPTSMPYLEDNLIEMIDAELKSLETANKKIEELESELKGDDAEEVVAVEAEVKAETVEPPPTMEEEDKENEVGGAKKRNIDLLCDETLEPEKKRCKLAEPEGDGQPETETKEETEEERKINAELENLEPALVKLLAYQRLQQILTENPDVVEKYHNRTAAKAIRELIQKEPKRNNVVLPSELLTKDDIAKIARKFTGAKDGPAREDGYASRSPSPVFTMDETTPGAENAAEMKTEESTDVATIPIDKNTLAESYWRSQIRARAVLTPVDEVIEGPKRYTKYYIDKSIFMRYRNLTIGAGPGADVHLNSFGHCRFVSKKHAIIFYDEVRHFQFEHLKIKTFVDFP
jgi:hypothetical protein